MFGKKMNKKLLKLKEESKYDNYAGNLWDYAKDKIAIIVTLRKIVMNVVKCYSDSSIWFTLVARNLDFG